MALWSTVNVHAEAAYLGERMKNSAAILSTGSHSIGKNQTPLAAFLHTTEPNNAHIPARIALGAARQTVKKQARTRTRLLTECVTMQV
jgi:hypothetical protein